LPSFGKAGAEKAESMQNLKEASWSSVLKIHFVEEDEKSLLHHPHWRD
jgi:hypothetical protein